MKNEPVAYLVLTEIIERNAISYSEPQPIQFLAEDEEIITLDELGDRRWSLSGITDDRWIFSRQQ